MRKAEVILCVHCDACARQIDAFVCGTFNYIAGRQVFCNKFIMLYSMGTRVVYSKLEEELPSLAVIILICRKNRPQK